jgi:hypothetical protein
LAGTGYLHQCPVSPLLVCWLLILPNADSTPYRCHRSPLVHGFPCPIRRLWNIRVWSLLRPKPPVSCVLTVASDGFSALQSLPSYDPFPVIRVLSSTLLPGFFGPESSVLPVNLPPSAPSAASGSPPRLQFYGLYCHCSRASLGKTHHLSISRPASPWFGSPDIRPRLPTRARPPPHSHIAGSLFATYMDSASCFLQAPVSGNTLALLALPFRPVTAGVLLLPATPSYARSSANASCQAHVSWRRRETRRQTEKTNVNL